MTLALVPSTQSQDRKWLAVTPSTDDQIKAAQLGCQEMGRSALKSSLQMGQLTELGVLEP